MVAGRSSSAEPSTGAKAWEHWEVPLSEPKAGEPIRLRFVTDSYSRAQDRTAPTWKWALWGRPRLIRDMSVVYDFIEELHWARRFVRLDTNGKDRSFDHGAEDSTGATFDRVTTGPAIAAFTPHQGGQFGLSIGEYDLDFSAVHS